MKRLISALLLALCLPAAAAPLQAANLPLIASLPAQLSAEDVSARVEGIKATVVPLRAGFNAPSNDWDTESDEDVVRRYGPGVYHLRVETADMIGWKVSPDTAADFYAEVDTYHIDGPLDNEFGILFRSDGDNYYIFNVSSDGYYRLHKFVDDEWEAVVEWAESDAIVTGEGSHNRLGLLAEGPEISLLVNDQVLATVTDESVTGDGLALAVGTFDEGGVEIAFEDFTLWPLAGDRPEPDVTPEADDTPEPVRTPEAVATPQPTLDPALVESEIEPIRSADPDFSDDFSSSSDRWATYEGVDGSIAIASRGLTIGIDQPDRALWTSNEEIADLTPADLLAEVDTQRNAGAYNATYGLLVRFVDNDNYYYFGISGAGTYSFWRVMAGEWTRLVDWTETDAIDPQEGAVNRLGVLAQGDRFLLLVNDAPLAEAFDGTFPAGGVGVYAGVYEEAGLDVTFDNLGVWVLSQGEAALPRDEEAIAAAQSRTDQVRSDDPTYSARFRRDDGAWSLGEDENASIAVTRGALAIEVQSEQWLAWAANPTTVADFQLEVEIALADTSLAGEAGVVFRLQDESNFYFAAIDNTGRYSLWKKQDGEWHALQPWARSDLLLSGDGAQNILGVLAEGNRIAVSLNQLVVTTVEDDSFAAGSLALAIGSFDDTGVTAAFDNLSLWNLAE